MSLDKFIKDNKGSVPQAPAGEFSAILARIENNKTVWDLLKESFSFKPFWIMSTSCAALALVVTVQASSFFVDSTTETVAWEGAQLYQSFALTDSDFLE